MGLTDLMLIKSKSILLLGVANKTWCVTQNLAFYIHPIPGDFTSAFYFADSIAGVQPGLTVMFVVECPYSFFADHVVGNAAIDTNFPATIAANFPTTPGNGLG